MKSPKNSVLAATQREWMELVERAGFHIVVKHDRRGGMVLHAISTLRKDKGKVRGVWSFTAKRGWFCRDMAILISLGWDATKKEV